MHGKFPVMCVVDIIFPFLGVRYPHSACEFENRLSIDPEKFKTASLIPIDILYVVVLIILCK